MKRILLALAAWLALGNSTAHALPRNAPPAPIHIAFGDCAGFGTSDITNACNTNTGAIVIVGSFIPPVGIPGGDAMEAIVDVSQASMLSDWWRLDGAGCGAGRLHTNFDFESVDPLTNCQDPWQALANGGLGVSYPGPNPSLIPANSERIDVYCAVNNPVQFVAGQEYYLFALRIYRAHTVGGCGGCDVPTTLCINELVVDRGSGTSALAYSSDGSYQCLTYNSNSATPTRGSSWGAIKSLYR